MVGDLAERVRIRLRHQGGDPGDFDDHVRVGGVPLDGYRRGALRGGRFRGELDERRHDPLEPCFLVACVVGEEGEEGEVHGAQLLLVGLKGFSDAVGRSGCGDVDGVG